MSENADVSGDESEVEIARVREIRHTISAQFGHDPYRLVAHLIELQKEHPERLLAAPEAAELAFTSLP